MSFRKRLLNVLFWSVISAAFIGPGTVTTAAKAGADFGLPLLWALGFATLACLVLQEASARLTIVSGKNLGEAIYHQFHERSGSPGILIFVAVCILSGTLAYETGNLLGAMSGLGLLLDIAPWVFVLVTGSIAGMILYIPSLKAIASIMGSLVAIMGIAFLLTAILIKPPLTGVARGLVLPVIPLNEGGGLLVLGLIGTTVVPYNLFLGSRLSRGQNLGEMRSGLILAIVLGGVISMAVLITGTAVKGPFSFEALALALKNVLGNAGPRILAFGLFAAGFTSAVTAPLASAVTMQSLYGNRSPGLWKTDSARFRITWMLVLLTGMGFGMAGFKPVPAIVIAQALNGLILPVIGVFLLFAINNTMLMKGRVNSLKANILMLFIVSVAILLGFISITRTILSISGIEIQNQGLPLTINILLALVITFVAGFRVFRKQ